jgi:DNA polymerase-3 subunit delta
VYAFVGDDFKLVDRTIDAVEALVEAADRPFAVERVYAGEEGGRPIDIVAAARTRPMLGDRRVVIVLRAERLLKPKRGGKAALSDDQADDADGDEAQDGSPIEEYLDDPVDSTTLVFVATDIDRTRRLTKRLLQRAQVVEFRGLAADGPAARREGRATAADWLQDELTRAGRTIEPEAARILVGRCGHDISKLRGDVERLLLFAEGQRRITADDVMEVVADESGVDDEWGVVNAISAGNAPRALAEVDRRFDRGDSPHALVGQIRWWVSNRLIDADPSRVRGALEALLRADLALKSSGGDERTLVERLVVELTGRPVSQRGWGGRR